MNRCDHKSVGVLVWKNTSVLLIKRMLPPLGIAAPSGHVDEHGSFEEAAIAELREEVGMQAERLSLLYEGRLENNCRRPGGSWHYWKVYDANVNNYSINTSKREVKTAFWMHANELLDSVREQPNSFDPAWENIFTKLTSYIRMHG